MKTSLLTLGAQLLAALDQAPGLMSGVLPPEVQDRLYKDQYRGFAAPDVHVFSQVAGSTACGWGGMGGAAMTQYFAIALVFPAYDAAAVYITGRCAYVCKLDKTFNTMLHERKQIPTWDSTDRLHLYWKHNVRREDLNKKEGANA